jgi:HTH-type transcriptional regulator/antitoxin HigA
LWQYGIDFEIMRNFKGAPVQGFIYRRTDGILKICMTIRGSFADIFWFSLLHEIGHIVNGDLNKTKSFIDDGTDKAKEDAANQFAGDHLIDNTQYYSFVVQHGRYYTKNAIDRFAQEQGIPAYIVIGRLQKDKHIPYNSVFTKYKLRYKWIEE